MIVTLGSAETNGWLWEVVGCGEEWLIIISLSSRYCRTPSMFGNGNGDTALHELGRSALDDVGGETGSKFTWSMRTCGGLCLS